MSVVIVGGGHAGLQTADSLRSGGYTKPISIIEDEPQLPYQRPPLSKDYLATSGNPEPLPLRTPSFYAEKDIDLRTGVTATDLDRGSRTVAISDGSVLKYEHLVLATGARNRELTCVGATSAGVRGLKTLDDAQVLHRALATAKNVVVVGAGFIGLEFATAAHAHGCFVTVLEFASLPMGRALTPTTAEWFARKHQDSGIQLRLNEGIDHFDVGLDGRVAAAVSTAGTAYPADLVVVGIGVVPNDELAARAGLETENGVLVDATLRTSDPSILAIGDCASYPSIHTGTVSRLECVQNAAAHGRHAAQTILGTPRNYTEVPWFWSTQGKLRLQMAGIARAEDAVVVIGDPDAAAFSVLCYRDERLVAVESVNAPADHMAARKLLGAGRTPAPAEAVKAGFSLKAYAREALFAVA